MSFLNFGGIIGVRLVVKTLEEEGRGIARAPLSVMRLLQVKTGDFVEVRGRRAKLLRVWPDGEKEGDYVKIDRGTQAYCGLKPGDFAEVEPLRVEQRPARRLVLKTSASLPEKRLKEALLGKAVRRGERLYVDWYLTTAELEVVDVDPPASYVDEQTEVVVASGLVSWSDVGGYEDVKRILYESVVLPIKSRYVFEQLGVEPPRGILLVGPPGVGKTLLAKAAASEAGAYFTAINGPELVSKWVGESEARLREVFEEAKKNAPAVIFIDEIDAIAPRRDEAGGVERRLVAQLLVLMDGIRDRGDVFVLAATNRPDALDPALRRPGRFDKEVYIPLPDKKARREILAVHTRKMPLCVEGDCEVVDLDRIAEETHGFTGADLAALVREAALAAYRRGGRVVEMRDFREALRLVQPTAVRDIPGEVPEVKFADVGGHKEAKTLLRAVLQGGVIKSVLITGPQGVGKTLLAKAAAGEAGVRLFVLRGPEIMSKWVGESEKAVREVFKRAKAVAPAVVLIDGLEHIAPAGAHDDVTRRVAAQLIYELEELKNGVTALATYAGRGADPAVLAKFDLEITLKPPNKEERLEILKILARKMGVQADLEKLAEETEGYTGADLEKLLKRLALEKTYLSSSSSGRFLMYSSRVGS